MNKIIAQINKLDRHEDLKAIFAATKTRWKQLAREQTQTKFTVGQRVVFTASKTGERVFGRITKINTTTVSLRAEDGRQWRVSPQLLTAPFGSKKRGSGGR